MRSHRSRALSLLAVPLIAIGCQTQPDDDNGMAHDEMSADERASLMQAIEEANQAAEEARAAAEAARMGGGGGRAGINMYTPSVTSDQQFTQMAFPTGDLATSPILLHEVTPVSANRGEPYPVEYHVTNTTNATLQNVTLRASAFNNMNVQESTPDASPTAEGLLWTLGDMPGGETEIIRLTVVSDNLGNASNCITVAYNNELCASVPIVAPDLLVRKTATPEVLLCDPITLTYVVSNPGTGVAQDVQIMDNLPAGLALEDGSRTVRIDVGNLEPGGSREYTLVARAEEAGQFESPAMAMSSNLETESQAPSTVVRQPVLAVASDCIDEQYIVRPAVFSFDIGNIGDGVARNATAVAPIPEGVEIVSISDNGVMQGEQIVWNIGDMPPDATASVSYVIQTMTPRTVSGSISLSAYCAETVDDGCQIELVGIPAILLEVVDLVDPVEVGTETEYLIIITNQGTKPGTNIRLLATLPSAMEYVSSDGPTVATIDGQQVAFGPYRALAVGEEIEYRVRARATAEADARFLVQLRSDEMIAEEPVLETESTFLYE